MAETVNYGLYVKDDDQTKFIEWRKKVAGETGSNMVKIDAALKAHDDALAGKQAALTDGDGTTVSENAVDLDTPTRGIMTQAEYDALPAEQKIKGLYVISDGGEGPVYVTADELYAAVVEINAAKQNKLSGAAGQVVGFDAQGNAVAQAAPQTGLSQKEADGRYLKLTGGTVTGPASIEGVNIGCQNGESYILYADEDGAIRHGAEFLYGRCLIETMSSVGDVGGALEIVSPDVKETYDTTNSYDCVVLRGVESPVFDYDAANKKYVDDAVADHTHTADQAGAKPVGWKPFHVGTSAPSDTTQLWIDTTDGTGGIKYHDGSAWVHVPVAYT